MQQNGDTPLISAASMGNRAIVQHFINHKAKLDIQNNHGNTALHMAACHTHNSVVEQLVKAGAVLDVANEVIIQIRSL